MECVGIFLYIFLQTRSLNTLANIGPIKYSCVSYLIVQQAAIKTPHAVLCCVLCVVCPLSKLRA